MDDVDEPGNVRQLVRASAPLEHQDDQRSDPDGTRAVGPAQLGGGPDPDDGARPAGPAGGDDVDEEGDESFPASDPPGGWAGPDDDIPRHDRDQGGDPPPEADSDETAAAWERADPMLGDAPTG